MKKREELEIRQNHPSYSLKFCSFKTHFNIISVRSVPPLFLLTIYGDSTFQVRNLMNICDLRWSYQTNCQNLKPASTFCTVQYIQGVAGGTDQTSGECSLGQTIPI